MTLRFSSEKQMNKALSKSANKPLKYRNIESISFDGVTFKSGKERDRYQELVYAQKAGKISDLKIQVKYSFDLNGIHICSYLADFVYKNKNGKEIVEDTKSEATKKARHYRIKNKMMKAFYQIDIVEL
jgi:hypothetical protein